MRELNIVDAVTVAVVPKEKPAAAPTLGSAQDGAALTNNPTYIKSKNESRLSDLSICDFDSTSLSFLISD